MTDIIIRDARTGETLPGIPTPRLTEAGGGDAYFVPSDNEHIAGVWYLRDRGYESPTGEYRQVVVGWAR